MTVKLAKPLVPRTPRASPAATTTTPTSGDEDGTATPRKKKAPKPRKGGAKRERAPEDMSSTDSIFIRNLPAGITKEEVSEFLADLGPVWTHVSYKFVNSEKTNRTFRQYFGFAKLRDSDAQKKAISEYSGKEVGNRTVRISAVKEMTEQQQQQPEEPKEGST